MSWAKKCVNNCLSYIQEYGSATSLHGLPHVLTPSTHIIEKVVWLGAVAASVIGALLMIKGTFARFNLSPTVISRETDFRSWNTPMPASTFCVMNQTDPERVARYVKSKWGIDESDARFDYYRSFVEDVANFQLEDLSKFLRYADDSTLLHVNMLELTLQVIAPINATATIFNHDYNYIKYHLIVSETGICYSFAGQLSEIFFVRKENNFENGRIPLCNFLNSHCFTRIENLPQKGQIKFMVHSPYEVASLESSVSHVEPCEENDSTFKFFQIIASKELLELKPHQRKCKFGDEPGPSSELSKYSYNICRMECRKKLCHSLCGCAPFVYHWNGSRIRVCDVKGLACLAKYDLTIIKLEDEKKEYAESCGCFLNCEDLNFKKDRSSITPWVKPLSCNTRMRWAVEKYNRVRLRRDVIYSYDDFLVSIGGTAALYLGCSLLSFVELVYFFTLRLLCFVGRCRNRNCNRHPDPTKIATVTPTQPKPPPLRLQILPKLAN